VRARQLDRRDWNEPRHLGRRSTHDPRAVDDIALLDPSRRRERDAQRLDPLTALHHHRVIGVHHGNVVGVLIREDARLGRGVVVDGRMPVEMVVGEIEPQRDPRTERRRGLELKAAHLDDVDRLRRRCVHLRAERHADVAADQRVSSVRLHHPSDHGCRRRLPLRSGNRDDPSLHPSRGELHLTNHIDAATPCRLEQRLIRHHSRARHDQIRALDRRGRVSTELELDARGAQTLGLLQRRARFRQHDARSPANEQLRRGDAAASGTDHHNAAPFDGEWCCRHAITAASALSD
jgi:hypothetical protein